MPTSMIMEPTPRSLISGDRTTSVMKSSVVRMHGAVKLFGGETVAVEVVEEPEIDRRPIVDDRPGFGFACVETVKLVVQGTETENW